MKDWLIWPLATTLLFIVALARADNGKIIVQVPALVDSAASIDEDIKRECDIGLLVGNRIFEKIKDRNPAVDVVQQSTASSERFLRIRILNADERGISQLKRIRVVAEVVEDNNILAKNEVQGSSAQTARQDFSVCVIMERVAEKIGVRLARWVPKNFALPAMPKR